MLRFRWSHLVLFNRWELSCNIKESEHLPTIDLVDGKYELYINDELAGTFNTLGEAQVAGCSYIRISLNRGIVTLSDTH